jgi:hypothetical protein
LRSAPYAPFSPYFIAVIIAQIALSYSDVVYQDPRTVRNLMRELSTDRSRAVVFACPVAASGRLQSLSSCLMEGAIDGNVRGSPINIGHLASVSSSINALILKGGQGWN